jgi:hypothetical protein
MVGLGTVGSSNSTNAIWHLSLPFGHFDIDLQCTSVYTCTMQNKSWTVTVEEDPATGDLILPLPQDMLDLQGWKEGDTLEWTDNKDGSWSLSRK